MLILLRSTTNTVLYEWVLFPWLWSKADKPASGINPPVAVHLTACSIQPLATSSGSETRHERTTSPEPHPILQFHLPIFIHSSRYLHFHSVRACISSHPLTLFPVLSVLTHADCICDLPCVPCRLSCPSSLLSPTLTYSISPLLSPEVIISHQQHLSWPAHPGFILLAPLLLIVIISDFYTTVSVLPFLPSLPSPFHCTPSPGLATDPLSTLLRPFLGPPCMTLPTPPFPPQ